MNNTTHNLEKWRHPRTPYQPDLRSERSTVRVVLLTLFMMVVEITAGSIFGSMALLADGWHMGTHAAALGITLLAYVYARRMAQDRRFTFGTGKMSVLGGFTSAIVLLLVALLMVYESVERLMAPETIRFNEAILVAVVGLTVNLGSALLLGGHSHSHGHGEHDHDHDHGDEDHDDHDHQHAPSGVGRLTPSVPQDHNLKAAYLHVLADALTSVLAIAALLAGKLLGWVWMDAVIGIVGAVVISRWSLGLLRETGAILLDERAEDRLSEVIRAKLEADADNEVVDLYAWKVGSARYAADVSLVTHDPRPVEHYRRLLAPVDELVHLTVEVHVCEEEPCIARRRGRLN